ncbi:hypothetical protein CU098_010514 [Rhizopus stolonifer]|uniref:DOMON domain-containing protein n=1 Tax=Rhizopus stolonifer TaxID=4846 RepID=A0A367KK78_RHIST|nr:hypothetical protein CU098_010514 [Rhizopus stolonifer]
MKYLFLLPFLMFVSAFCVYNDSEEVSFYIHQQPSNRGANVFKAFKRESLKPGQNACCPYTTYDCAEHTSQEEIITLRLKTQHPSGHYDFFFEVSFPAGGWIQFTGKEDSIRAYAYDAHGQSVDYAFTESSNTLIE